MALLVTRPQPDGDVTAKKLRAKGYDVLLASMLQFEVLPLPDDPDAHYTGVIITSANALRALDDKPVLARLLNLPLFAIGKHTARKAQDAGFSNVTIADGDASKLRIKIRDSLSAKDKRAEALLYLAGTDLSRDLAGELREDGFDVVMQTAYRMVPVPSLPAEVCDAFAANYIEAVLHYSRRSALAFIDATRTSGIQISVLAIPQYCLSERVSDVVREAGANQVMVARKPDEKAMFEALDRVLGPVNLN